MTRTNVQSLLFGNDQLRKIATDLEAGDLILYPTDTIWGIGCDATNPTAVEKVFELKRRDRSKPFVILVSSIKMLKAYVREVHPRMDTLLSHHTRPLTVIYDQGLGLAPNAIGQDGSVAIRVVQDDFCRNLIDSFGKPMVATSANISNEPFPGNFGEISSAVISQVDHVVRFRQEEKSLGEPSVLVKVEKNGDFNFLRS